MGSDRNMQGKVGLVAGLAIILLGCYPLQAQVPKYEVDPTWPKPLPGLMVTGRAGGICVDAQDHIFEVNRGDLQDKEKLVATPAPPVLEYDSDGNLVNSFGDFKTAPSSIHGCITDKENNIFVAGNDDAVVQKYTHDGSKMLLQIGTKGLFDSSTGLITGIAMNQSKTLLNKPADIAVDPSNGDVYIADGYGDHRIAVFDKSGKFLASWKQFGRPSGVWVDNNDMIYVADSQSDADPAKPNYNGGCKMGIRVGSVKDGKVQYYIPPPAGTSDKVPPPEGITVDSKGTIYAAAVQGLDVKKYTK